MKIALGIHVGHDRGACLIKDGEVIAMIAQERLDRIKHSKSMEIPYLSIDALLTYCDIKMSDISCIGFSHVAVESDVVLRIYQDEFLEHYNCSHIPFYFVSHHDAHAYAAFFSSSFSESLVMVADGGGDFINGKQEAETMYIAKGGHLSRISRRLQHMAVRHMQEPINTVYPFMPENLRNHDISLARKYSQITHLLGFGFGEEGKTMGLASYGKPLIDFNKYTFSELDFSLKYRDIIHEIYVLQSLSGQSYQDFLRENRADIARTVQDYTEHAIVSIINSFTAKYTCRNLCLSGGLFLNCLTNHKVLEKCNIDQLFILPASGDDGQALGSAYYAYLQQFGLQQRFFKISLPYLGLSYSDKEIVKSIQSKNLIYEKYDDETLAALIAHYIKKNKIIAIHRGRTEIGPRALCHRSILANAMNPDMKEILNNRVKHREDFRPFAPTVTEEDQYTFFNLKSSSNYMLLATEVNEKYRTIIPSVTHVDNTARIQAVSEESDPFIYLMLKKLKEETGYPVVLNTSFNVAGQPIVESPLDAINTFLDTDIDILVLGNYLLNKDYDIAIK